MEETSASAAPLAAEEGLKPQNRQFAFEKVFTHLWGKADSSSPHLLTKELPI